MVKRAIAVVAGAAAGAALWFIVSAWKPSTPDSEPTIISCVREGLVDCVQYEVPAPSEITQPCKAWLGATSDGATALLSQCLHEARRDSDRATEEVRRKRAIAASS